MFYAAMYALKGREDRRAASALQQMTGVNLGGEPGTPAFRAPHAALRATTCPPAALRLWLCSEQRSGRRSDARLACWAFERSSRSACRECRVLPALPPDVRAACRWLTASGRCAARAVAPARTVSLQMRSFVTSQVPAISDCGLFGTTCDGNTYLQVRRSQARWRFRNVWPGAAGKVGGKSRAHRDAHARARQCDSPHSPCPRKRQPYIRAPFNVEPLQCIISA